MKYILLFLLFIISVAGHSQKNDDKIIIINIADSLNARSAILKSLMKNEFIIKDIENKDTIITYPVEMKSTPGYVVIVAAISGNVVRLVGSYSHKKINYFGNTGQSKDYIPIRYYSSSKTWRVLNQVAIDTGGTLSYADK